MRYVKILLCAAGAVMLAACNSSSSSTASSTASSGAVTGVATASQISVVTAK